MGECFQDQQIKRSMRLTLLLAADGHLDLDVDCRCDLNGRRQEAAFGKPLPALFFLAEACATIAPACVR